MHPFLISLFIVIFVFSVHFIFISHNLLVPLLWSLFFVYMYKKNYFNIAINTYLLFILLLFSDYLNFESFNTNQEFAYFSLVMFITFVFLFTYQILGLHWPKIAKVFGYAAAITSYAILVLYFLYAVSFESRIIEDSIYMASHLGYFVESRVKFISAWWTIAVLFSTILMGYLLLRLKIDNKVTSKMTKLLLFFSIILTLFIVISKRHDIRLIYFIKDLAKHDTRNHVDALKFRQKSEEKREQTTMEVQASKDKQGETYIVVISEALNKKHMGLYGYIRNTTPLLTEKIKNSDLLLFTNAYSSYVHSMPLFTFSLSEINQYNNKNYDSLSIIDVLNKANIETYWINTHENTSAKDEPISVMTSKVDHLVSLNHSTLISEVKKILAKKMDSNRVIFVYLSNRWNYSSRYPQDKYTFYNEKVKLGEFGTVASKNSNINHYDNGIHYNDYIVNSLLEEFQKEQGTGGFIYMAEYAEDVIKNLGHLSSVFTYETTQIPMMAYFTKDYKKIYNNKYNTFVRHKSTLFSNDMFYDTLIGLFDVKTDRYNSKYDLFSENYKLDAKDALALYGQINYADKSNYIYWQKINTQYLIDNNNSSRVIPHRVNSIGKLKDIWNDGFRSFEFDISFGDNDTNYFHVGHHSDVMGIKMEDFLSSVDVKKIEKVWFDFKNLDQNNYKQAIKRLEYLDKKYQIKKKFIIESTTTFPFFKEVSKAGWHTSHYMPTKKIIKLLKEDNKDEMQKLAIEIAKQTKIQNVSAVSFDHRLYFFIKNYLEPNISDEVVYHIWDAPNLDSDSFAEELLNNKLYLDHRVKTLLTEYISQFNL